MKKDTKSEYVSIIISQFIRIITGLVMMLIFEQLKFFTKTDVLCIGSIAILYIGISTIARLILSKQSNAEWEKYFISIEKS